MHMHFQATKHAYSDEIAGFLIQPLEQIDWFDSYLGEGPVLCNTHKGQSLLQAQGTIWPFYYVHKVDVAIADLLHLHDIVCV